MLPAAQQSLDEFSLFTLFIFTLFVFIHFVCFAKFAGQTFECKASL